MSLTLVAVPIGNPQDISLRALETLRTAELMIGEERKPLFRLFKELGLETPKNYELLNEHSSLADVEKLAEQCRNLRVALVTDCGTPGFSDPGAELVRLCRQNGIPVTSNPGASSLTTFLSLCGQRLPQFDFVGFLPRDREERERALRILANHPRPFIVMDTPYRLGKFLEEGKVHFTNWRLAIGLELTKPEELVLDGSFGEISKQLAGKKWEFMALIYKAPHSPKKPFPKPQSTGRPPRPRKDRHT